MRRWLEPARVVVDELAALGALDPMRSIADSVSQLCTLRQLDNLRTHPAVNDALARSELALHAWWFDIPTGDVLAYSEREQRFVTAVGELERAGHAIHAA